MQKPIFYYFWAKKEPNISKVSSSGSPAKTGREHGLTENIQQVQEYMTTNNQGRGNVAKKI